MKQILLAAVLAAASGPAFAGDVAVSVSVGQPGFYGQIDIGNVVRPPVVYAQPVVVERVPEYREVAPLYLHVPPGHEKHWSKHCREYDACNRPVYFVRHDWYENEYVAQHQHGERDRDDGHDHGRHDGKHDRKEHHGRDD